MVLDMHDHSANQGPFGIIHGGTPRIEQLDRGSLQCDR